ncbi:MAG: SMC-Scp complex subunit ScpB, partial [Romboutsia timonensis]|uniref:SMC-Scp complex subunit ScpB n=1 Tax=Romboutsia timonensis TaxID=1776391 RepID=UPI002A75FA13
TLINNDLIVVSGVSNKIGRPKLYKTTDTFLKLLGISSLSELPDLEKFKNEQLNLLDDIK